MMFARNRIHSDEHVLKCPNCATADPATPLLQLANWVTRSGQLVGIITGQYVGCRRCPASYDVGPEGVVAGSLQMPQAQVDWNRNAPPEGWPKTIDVPDDDAPNEYRPPRPRPKEAPPV